MSPFHILFNLFDPGGLNADDLIEEPVTSGSDSSLWEGYGNNNNSDDEEERKKKNRNRNKPKNEGQ